MNFVNQILEKVNKINSPKTIVLIDGDDPRMIEAAKKIKETTNIQILLLVEKEIQPVDGLNFINIFTDSEKINVMIEKYVELRKGKETLEQARQAVATRPVYAMLLLALGEVDGVVGGLAYPTSDILRAAFKTIGPKKGIKTISSVMIMHKENEETLIFSDISVNPEPNAEQLADIAANATEFAKQLNFDPKVAFLSFSTDGSAKTDKTLMVREATDLYNLKHPSTLALGEIQLDAALDLKVRAAKYKRDSYSEKSNVLIFPDLGAGNIGYKLVQRLANYGAIGPVVVGAAKPVNDLSRGSSVEDVYNTILITVLQSEGTN
ncbi:phosphate acetyltransferase [Mycoplasmopsis pullorum]|uniref:phosphate acetyltransferase n=1 Tax=Mycoplasmopsis pullorum TaxID=48003 RepID=UPI00111AE8D4|nr:phosphate acetyltransferase [Mycoplasmopsis pullorum]TNK83775.1 phosphate acetyltransferase [Mycoplasmopsis pullorum]TNK92025.1 phosphate acetyltransferase [Mycoplasmopsis pullorum]